MQVNISKKNVMPFIIICTLPHISFADDRIDDLQQKIDRTYITTPNGTCGAYTASARPTLNSCNECCGSNWNIGASLLYWQGKTCATEYAYGKQHVNLEIEYEPQDVPLSLPTKGNIYNVDSQWNYGFKVAIGYNFNHDGWESNLSYTNFMGKGSDQTKSGCNDSIIPLTATYSITSTVDSILTNTVSTWFLFCTEAKSNTELYYRSLFWDIARDFFVSDCLSIRPFTGLQAAWITTRQNTRYSGGTPIARNILGLENEFVRVKENCRFNGLGPVMGLSANWHLGRGISLFNEFTMGLLYGRFQSSHREKYSGNNALKISLKSGYHKFCPLGRYNFGLAQKCYLNDDQNYLTAKVGCEFQYWWRVNQIIRIVQDVSATIDEQGISVIKPSLQGFDLSIIGVTVDLRLDF